MFRVAAVLALVALAPAARAATIVDRPVAAGIVAAPAVVRGDLVDLGPAPATTAVRIGVILRYRNEGELEQLLELQATPGSRLYHHFLTPEQFAQYFSPSQESYARVARALVAAGFRLGPQYPNRTVIDASGSPLVASRFFATRIDRVVQYGHGVHYANVTPATLPALLESDVAGVLGFDDLTKVHTDHERADVEAAAAEDEAEPAASPGGPIERISGGSFAGLYPTGIATAYGFPVLSGFTGKGHAIAIVMDSDIANADLKTYWTAAGITRTGKLVRVHVDGANPGIDYDVGETAIDTETSSGLAPGATIDLYLVASLADQPLEDAYNLAVSDNAVDVVNSSFGGCELDDKPFADATNKIAMQGASEGLTFIASTGDSGGDCEDETASSGIFYEPDIVNSPASDPYFLAVGATALHLNAKTGKRVSEAAWSPGGPRGGSGGGVSSLWPLPAYQDGVEGMAVVPNVTVTPPATQPNKGFAGRNLPDISVDGANGAPSYLAIYDSPDGGWTGYGGTSVSAPIVAALLAERNQQAGSRSGYANPALYSAFTENGAQPAGVYGTEFFDVTQGGTTPWKAKTGYDQTTGIGTFTNAAFEPKS
jgi:kumamolisin